MMKVFELVVADEEADGKGYTRRTFVEKRLPQPIVRRHAKKSTITETVVSAEQHVSKSSIARQKRRRKKDVVVSLPKMQQPDRSISAPETLEIVAVAPTISFDSTKCRARRLEADAVEAYYRRRRVFPVEKAAAGNKAYRGFDRRSCVIVQNEIEAMKCISLRERFFELGLSPEYVEPFRKCSIEVVEAIVKWRMNTRRQFQWKQYPSYLEKMRGDLGSRNPLFLPLDDQHRERIGELADEAYFQRAMRAHQLIFADDGPQTLLNKRTFVTEDETDRAPRFLHSRSLPAIRRKLTDGT